MDVNTDDTSCALCFEEFREPRKLDCSHAFCYPCLQRETMNGCLQCPMYTRDSESALPKNGLDGLPSDLDHCNKRVFGVIGQTGIREEENNREKSVEDKTAAQFCCQCSQTNQHLCLSVPNLLKLINNGHRIPDSKKAENGKTLPTAKYHGFCEQHDYEELKFYCQTCKLSICRDCAMLEHRTHSYVYYKYRERKADNVQERLIEVLSQVEEKRKTLNAKIQLFDINLQKRTQQIDAAKAKIRSKTLRLKKLITEQEDILVECLDEHRERLAESVDVKKSILKAALDEVNASLEFAQESGLYGKTQRKTLQTVLPQDIRDLDNNAEKEKSTLSASGVNVVMETDTLSSHLKLKCASQKSPVNGIKDSFVGGIESSDDEKGPQVTAPARARHDRNDVISEPDQSDKHSRITGLDAENYYQFDFEKNPFHRVNDHEIIHCPPTVIPTFKHQTCFGKKGSNVEEFQDPVGIAAASDGTLVIADFNNDRVQLFTPDGEFIRVITHVITEKGRKMALLCPTGVACDKAGNVIIAERGRHRMTVMNQTGNLIRKFGKLGKAYGQFRDPHGVSVDRRGRVIVADTANNRIQVFDKDGDFIFAFGDTGEHKLDYPNYALFHNGAFIVSDTDNDSVKVFNKEGQFLRYLSTEDQKEGHFCVLGDQEDPFNTSEAQEDPLSTPEDQEGLQCQEGPSFSAPEDQEGPFSAPSGLAVYKEKYILVCDFNRDCIKVFTLDGKYLSQFGGEGSNPGQFCGPEAVTVLPDGRVVVSDKGNNRLQIFE